ncbi:MAG: methyltransferase domain-containing protein [Pseudomonadota bacterium]
MAHPDVPFWDRTARKYARDPIADMESYRATLARMQALLAPKDRVLELGAGTTSTARELAPGVAAYLATDISAEMIRIGKEKQAAEPIPGLRLEVARGVPEGRFDAVLALTLLHLVPDLNGMLAEVADRLAPGGLFLSKTACLGAAPLLGRIAMRALIPVMGALRKAPGTVRFLAADTLDAAIASAGFEIEETRQETGATPRRFIVARRL